MLDVDGRLGGFNFQWAWSTARVAGGDAVRPVGMHDPADSETQYPALGYARRP